jgi:hypothetical protein
MVVESSTCGAYCIALVVIVLLLVAAVIGVGYLYVRVGRLTVATTQFSNLRSSFAVDAEDDDEAPVSSQSQSTPLQEMADERLP